MKVKSPVILFLVLTLITDIHSQINDIKTDNLSQEEWEAARDYYAIEVIKLMAKLDTLNAEIDSVIKINYSLEVLDCEYHLYKLSGITYEELSDFRIKFLETEYKILNKAATAEEIRQKYFSEISLSALKCLPEFSERFIIL